MKRIITLILSFLLATALTSCGFQLRGTSAINELPFKTVYVNAHDESRFAAELKRAIKASRKTKLVSQQEDAEAIIDISNEIKLKSIYSMNIRGRVREYLLRYRIGYNVRNPKNEFTAKSSSISLSRKLQFTEKQALARENEEEFLYKDMETEAVQQLLYRLAAIRTSSDDITTPEEEEEYQTTQDYYLSEEEYKNNDE